MLAHLAALMVFISSTKC